MIKTEMPGVDDYRLDEGEMLFTRFPELIKLLNERSAGAEPDYREKRAHYASDTHKCLREQYYAWKRYPETNPMPELVKRQQDAGRVYEKWLKDLVKRAGIWAGEEVSVTLSDPQSSMRIDVLFDDEALRYFYSRLRVKLGLVRELPPIPAGQTTIPVEIKSVQPYAFTGKKDSPGYEDMPMWAHYCQVQMYLLARKAQFGFLVYVNRGTSEIAAHLVLYDEALLEKLTERQRALDWFLANDTVPEREGSVSFGNRGGYMPSRRCGICPFQYYDFFDEIMENGTVAETSKVMRAIEEIPSKYLTDSMRAALG